jgi:hypothetical protein
MHLKVKIENRYSAGLWAWVSGWKEADRTLLGLHNFRSLGKYNLMGCRKASGARNFQLVYIIASHYVGELRVRRAGFYRFT